MRISIEIDENTSREELSFALITLANEVKRRSLVGQWTASASGHRFISLEVPTNDQFLTQNCQCDIRIGPLLRKKAFAPVYLAEGREWLSVGEISELRETTEIECQSLRARIPEWARANVLQRVSEVEVREL